MLSSSFIVRKRDGWSGMDVEEFTPSFWIYDIRRRINQNIDAKGANSQDALKSIGWSRKLHLVARLLWHNIHGMLVCPKGNSESCACLLRIFGKLFQKNGHCKRHSFSILFVNCVTFYVICWRNKIRKPTPHNVRRKQSIVCGRSKSLMLFCKS